MPNPNTAAAASGKSTQMIAFNVVNVDDLGKIIQTQSHQTHIFKADLENGINLEMAPIPKGSFLMGSLATEEGRNNTEQPQHPVTMSGFWLGRYPITQAQWQQVAAWPKVKMNLETDPSEFKGANRPIENVSLNDALEFCARLSQQLGQTYRLPSEAEWEYACRAGTTTPFYFGNTITTDLANYRGTNWEFEGKTVLGSYRNGPQGTFRRQTTEVGMFPPNAFGLYDMYGNVWEWCADLWHETYNNAPSDGSAWVTGGNDLFQLLRGGSFIDLPRYCRSAHRFGSLVGFGNYHCGFRVACSGSPNPLS